MSSPMDDKTPATKADIEYIKEGFNKYVQESQRQFKAINDFLASIQHGSQPAKEQGQESTSETAEVKIDKKGRGMWTQKLSESSLGELVQAGDLAFKIHDRRTEATDLEKFLMETGKESLQSAVSSFSHGKGAQSIKTDSKA